MTDYERECVEAALEVAEELLMSTPHAQPEWDKRVVATKDILRIVQELNASLDTEITHAR